MNPPYGPQDLTIAISTLERREMLKAAVDSLIPHTPEGVSLVLTLNQSPPDILEYVQPSLDAWPGPVRVREIPERLSFTEGHNRILDEIETRLVNFMGDDDLVLGPRFEKVFALYDEHPTLGAVGCYATRMGGPLDNLRFRGRAELGAVTIDEWKTYRDEPRPYTLVFPTVVFSTEALRAVGGFDDRFELACDYRLIGVLTQHGPVLVLPERDVFGFRVHMGSESAKAFHRQFLLGKWSDYSIAQVRAGEPEPTFEDYLEHDRARPALARLNSELRRRSMAHFRFAGARMLDGQTVRGTVDLAKAFAYQPLAFLAKARSQFGRS